MDKYGGRIVIIHLFPKSKFAEPFINFLEQNFDISRHEILLYENGPHDFSDEWFEQAYIYDMDAHDLGWIYRKLQKAEKIIFHNLSVKTDTLFLLSLNKRFLNKSAWFIWGGDLYCFRDKRTGLAEHVVEYVRKRVIQTIPLFISWISSDCRLANLWYKTDSVNMPVAYYDEELVSVLSALKETPKKQSKTVKILVGNSATRTNNHAEVLDFLKKWAEDDIEIVAPLSYGDSSYGDEIEEMGKAYFGNKFNAIRTFMSRGEYFSLLNEMDVVIFNHDRQQALGNIVALLSLGKKLYLRNSTTMWETLVDDMGFEIFTIEELKESTLNDLKNMDNDIIRKNEAIARKHYDLQERVKEWEAVFSYDIKK